MLNLKENIKTLIADIYKCQKKIMVNRRFIRELEILGYSNNTSRLKYEITLLQRKIALFQDELKIKYTDPDF